MENGKVRDFTEFSDSEAPSILARILQGDLTPIADFISRYPDEEIVFSPGEVKIAKLREIAISLARIRMKEFLGDDYILEQTLALYDDVVSNLNVLRERLLEISRLEEILGAELEEGRELRNTVSSLEDFRTYLAERVEKRSRDIAPNLSTLLGPIIAARLIHYAGGLHRLARMPASTIQVLGAEDAFFQHLKKGTPCPKHGIIFQVAEIRNSPKRIRGKIARALAGKIAIAARVDYYGGEFIGERLKEEFRKRVEEIKNDTPGKGR